jgi:PleD family two-component response regulator
MKVQLDKLTGTALGLLHAAIIGWLFTRLINPGDAVAQLGMLTLTSCLIGYYLGSYAQQLREASIRDFLTGVYNRRYFAEQFRCYADRCARNVQPISLAMLDLDNFKLHNDTHGHDEGDRLLVKVAQIMNTWPTAKLVCRWGGEEFLMLFPGLSGTRREKNATTSGVR